MSFATPRRFERFNCDMAVWIHPSGETEPLLAEVLNISGGGFLCIVDRPMETHQRMDVSVELPQRSELVPVIAEIRHIREHEDGNYLIGLEFKEIEGMAVPAFIAYIEAMFL
ncbi:PilZ domain-containing protein [Acanthopleuribacter pedis]|uniref:PilZ domain-containing protein n=1 Tax=Acanthopleuribacter pedis TaxID=442870 RepID=A0A8J7U6D9_9BACT|nr:PilZ domain-containing protein [Acanthopleuribacter pedis]MBO1321358.1 PilZ domain-containing protein [Acanthopleuribacter pedis]